MKCIIMSQKVPLIFDNVIRIHLQKVYSFAQNIIEKGTCLGSLNTYFNVDFSCIY